MKLYICLSANEDDGYNSLILNERVIKLCQDCQQKLQLDIPL